MQFLKSKLFPVINNDYMAIQKGKQSNTCIAYLRRTKYLEFSTGSNTVHFEWVVI